MHNSKFKVGDKVVCAWLPDLITIKKIRITLGRWEYFAENCWWDESELTNA